jgi:hypothetical protein
MKKLSIILLCLLLCSPTLVFAVTEFVCSIKESNGDYATLYAWEDAIECDLTDAANKVFSHGGITGTVADAASVTGETSGATGTVYHCTSTQIFIAVASGTFESGEQVYVTVDEHYVVISDAGDTARATAEIDGTWTNPETTTLSIGGWTTSATNYIDIYTTATARHDGKWKADAYRLEVAQGVHKKGINIYSHYVRMSGLQVKRTVSTYAANHAIDCGLGHEAGDIRISCCVLEMNDSSSYNNYGIYFNKATSGTCDVKIWNNILYDFHNSDNDSCGIYLYGYGNFLVVNNTCYNCDKSYYMSCQAANTCYCYNNIAQASEGDAYDVSSLDGGDYNISDDATDTGGAHDKTSASVTFVGGSDYHLGAADTTAKDAGTDLSGGGLFDDDIDGDTRSGTWDIGADEYVGAASAGQIIMISN